MAVKLPESPFSSMPPARLDAALKRLSAALDQLEAAADRTSRAGAEKRDLADTLAVMQDDRGRLANELDAALTRSQALEHATEEVAHRLGHAGGVLRQFLTEADAAETEILAANLAREGHRGEPQ